MPTFSPLDAVNTPTTFMDTLANIEALVPKIGDTGYPMDSPYVLVCETAGTWIYLFPSETGICTPPDGGPSTVWINQSTSTVTNIGKMSRFLFSTTGFGVTTRAGLVAAGATFDVRVKLRRRQDPVDYHYVGLVLRESGTDKCVLVFPGQIQWWNNSTAYTGSEVLANSAYTQDGWYRAVLDATNITYYGSLDGGLTWVQLLQQAKNSRFTVQPNQVGVFGNTHDAAAPREVTADLLSWNLV